MEGGENMLTAGRAAGGCWRKRSRRMERRGWAEKGVGWVGLCVDVSGSLLGNAWVSLLWLHLFPRRCKFMASSAGITFLPSAWGWLGSSVLEPVRHMEWILMARTWLATSSACSWAEPYPARFTGGSKPIPHIPHLMGHS